LSSSQINVALELHHSLTNTTHPFPSPIALGNLADDPTTAGACHLTVDQPPRASTGQIGPTSVIPYLRSCLATTPSTQNWVTGEEPPQNFTGGRFSLPRIALPDVVTPLPLTRGPTPTAFACAVPPFRGSPARTLARAPAGPKFPPGPVSRKPLFFFLFPFLFPVFIYLCIY
jgi:hypothetical protein